MSLVAFIPCLRSTNLYTNSYAIKTYLFVKIALSKPIRQSNFVGRPPGQVYISSLTDKSRVYLLELPHKCISSFEMFYRKIIILDNVCPSRFEV